jgi:hypothetical protein
MALSIQGEQITGSFDDGTPTVLRLAEFLDGLAGALVVSAVVALMPTPGLLGACSRAQAGALRAAWTKATGVARLARAARAACAGLAPPKFRARMRSRGMGGAGDRQPSDEPAATGHPASEIL